MTPGTAAPPSGPALIATQASRAGTQHPLSFARPTMNAPAQTGTTSQANSPRTINSTSIRRAQSAAIVDVMERKKKERQAYSLMPHVMPLLMHHVAKALVHGNNGDGMA